MAKSRFSSRAMNNVVIFAMLFMILLFNLDSFLPTTGSPQDQPLVPEHEYLLRIEQDHYRLERVGQVWRQSQLESPIDTSPEAQFSAWQRGYLAPTDRVPATIANGQAYIVILWLAGKSDGLVYAFHPGPTHTYVQVNNQWFVLKDTTLPQLLPWNKPFDAALK
ncbi:hypothetical protein [Salinimonas sediminis]|uniref:Uncharacterized protein n=1 Tax=Salinimonas sediminis TaxID=2303538 RepID=A0A346NRX2_9ALTE|nr:hypothetical protein [Salinimonas sediminis]AXR08279.1 hypothetical protein D0Y50_19125 [Salinimonas sediminis]